MPDTDSSCDTDADKTAETEPSLRIADHVGFILNHEDDHNITLFHVDSGEGKNVDVILEQAHAPALSGGGDLVIVDAALYKALHRLEDAGAIEAEWGLSDNNRRAKYYALTSRGRAMLRAEAATWRRYAAAVGRILEAS